MELAKLLQRLTDEGLKVLQFFEGLVETSWEFEIYTEGEVWKAHQILAHFVSVERAFQWLTADIVSGGLGTPQDFDLDRFNHDQVMELEAFSRQELLSTFQSARNHTIQQASSYSSEDLAREGHHPWFGLVSVETLLKLLYRHNQMHIRDIRRQLGRSED